MIKLKTPIQYLSGVGPKMAKKLQRLGIENVRDLLFYFPWRYDDFSQPQKIKQLRIGQEAIIKAKILQIKLSRTRRKWMSIIEAILADDSGEIKAIWFNQPFLMKILKPGDEWLFAGRVNWDFKNKSKTITPSQYENPQTQEPMILPIYSETEGLTSKYLRKIIKPVIAQIDKLIKEFLPDNLRLQEKLLELKSALKKIHCPQNQQDISKARERLAFDELFLISLKLLINKKELLKNSATAFKIDTKLLKAFVNNLPFKLTNAQRKSAWEIIKDLSHPVPMNRLLEGDVGSGKTVVAAMAVLVAAKNKYNANSNWQSVWLAPTEILANQHFQNIYKLFKKFQIRVGLLTSANQKADLKKDDLIIGTHALLQKNISFPRLALIIVDEQHRFGVKQRAHLRQGYGGQAHLRKSEIRNPKSERNIIPHLLSLTATPIPRTLALSIYGDLNLSIIDEMPPGRQKVITRVVNPENRKKAYDFIQGQVKQGRQVFVICPLIEIQNANLSDASIGVRPNASDKVQNDNSKFKIGQNKLFDIDRKSAVEEYEKLSKNIFPDLKIGLLHGRLKSKEKSAAMKKFQQGKINILVSTAVVEVGIDIPNATVMMIEGAERFGLAQLHQFRGRVGRGKFQSYCFLFSQSWSKETKQRLSAMISCHNGFALAEKDLQIRGPGELAGIRQSGLPDLKMASLSDIILVKRARKSAEEILKNNLEKYPQLKEKLEEFKTERHWE
ncbi:MAG: ATP-dependent DNA helicase RecG [Patescibacteria group bacterium]